MVLLFLVANDDLLGHPLMYKPWVDQSWVDMKFHGVVSWCFLNSTWPFSPDALGFHLGVTRQKPPETVAEGKRRSRYIAIVAYVQTHVRTQTHELIRAFRCIW